MKLFRWLFPAKRYRHPASVCAWCDPKRGALVLSWVTTTSIVPPRLSHGLCEECEQQIWANLDRQVNALTVQTLPAVVA